MEPLTRPVSVDLSVYCTVDLQFNTVLIFKISTPKNIEMCKMTSKIWTVTPKLVPPGVMTSKKNSLMEALPYA